VPVVHRRRRVLVVRPGRLLPHHPAVRQDPSDQPDRSHPLRTAIARAEIDLELRRDKNLPVP